MIVIVFSFVLALIASWFILRPVIEGVVLVESNPLLDLQLEKERLFQRLEELEQDKTLARVSEEGYVLSKQELFTELSRCMENLKK